VTFRKITHKLFVMCFKSDSILVRTR